MIRYLLLTFGIILLTGVAMFAQEGALQGKLSTVKPKNPSHLPTLLSKIEDHR